MEGKMDTLINKYNRLNYQFLLPTKNQLCETLRTNAPEYLITEKNDYSFNCVRKDKSKYKLLTSTQKLNNNSIYIFKRSKE